MNYLITEKDAGDKDYINLENINREIQNRNEINDDSNKFKVIGCSWIENTLAIADTVSLKKLKYLKKNNIPKQNAVDPATIIFGEIFSLFSSIIIAAKYETNVVDRINTTYLGFQLM